MTTTSVHPTASPLTPARGVRPTGAVPVGRRFTDAEIVDHEARIAARTGGP